MGFPLTRRVGLKEKDKICTGPIQPSNLVARQLFSYTPSSQLPRMLLYIPLSCLVTCLLCSGTSFRMHILQNTPSHPKQGRKRRRRTSRNEDPEAAQLAALPGFTAGRLEAVLPFLHSGTYAGAAVVQICINDAPKIMN